MHASKELLDYVIEEHVIIVDGDFEFSKAETLKVLLSTVVTHPPYFNSVFPVLLNPESNATLLITGEGLSNNTIVKFSTDRIIVTGTRLISPNAIEVDITITESSSIGAIDIALFNGCNSSTMYQLNNGIGALQVVLAPSGVEKYLRIASASGDNYIGTSFAKTEYSNSYSSDNAFDNNNGSRHYSIYMNSQDHHCGIIMSVPTLLTKLGYDGINGSSVFTIQGSNNSTNGIDGTWVDLFDMELESSVQEVTGQHVYNAFRLKWSNPDSSSFASAREIKIIGRQ